jgi:hypothetical protein
VPADVVVFVLPVGELDACVQQAVDGIDVEEFISLT